MAEPGAIPSSVTREILPGVRVCRDAEALTRTAARQFVDWAWQSIARAGKFCVALSGGHTPLAMYSLLATAEYRAQVDWPRVHLFWGDERAVPPENSESNYGAVRRELLLKVPIPPVNVHRMHAESANMGRAAHDYEEALRQNLALDDHGFPRFHLIMLGMGVEGHTASLFPGSRTLRHTSRWVSTPLVAKLGARRMTLTLPVLDAAERILFMITGSDKAALLKQVLEGTTDPPVPAQMVQPRNGERYFLLDEAAAAFLPQGAASESNGRRARDVKGPR
jgi:6-phosphogluconolactonase